MDGSSDEGVNFQLAPQDVRERSQEDINLLLTILASRDRGEHDVRTVAGWLLCMQPFDRQPPKVARLAARVCTVESHKRDRKVFRKGEPADKFYLIITGSISIFAESESMTLGGRKVPGITAMLSTGDTVGGATVASATAPVWTITALASTNVQLLALRYRDYQGILLAVAAEKFAAEKRFARSVPFLADMSDTKIERFFLCARKRILPLATVFWRPGAFVGNIYLIQSGRVRLSRPYEDAEGGGEVRARRSDGSSLIEGPEICDMGPGAIIGGPSFFERGGRYIVHAVAATRIVAWEVLKLNIPKALDEGVRAGIEARAARFTASGGLAMHEFAPPVRTPSTAGSLRSFVPPAPPPPPERRRPSSAWVRLSVPPKQRPRRPASAAPSSKAGDRSDPEVEELLELREALRSSSPPPPEDDAASLAPSASAPSLVEGLLRARISAGRPASASAASLRRASSPAVARPASAATLASSASIHSMQPLRPPSAAPLGPASGPALPPPDPREELLEGPAGDARVLETLHPRPRVDPALAALPLPEWPRIRVPFAEGAEPHFTRPTSASVYGRAHRAAAVDGGAEAILAQLSLQKRLRPGSAASASAASLNSRPSTAPRART